MCEFSLLLVMVYSSHNLDRLSLGLDWEIHLVLMLKLTLHENSVHSFCQSDRMDGKSTTMKLTFQQ